MFLAQHKPFFFHDSSRILILGIRKIRKERTKPEFGFERTILNWNKDIFIFRSRSQRLFCIFWVVHSMCLLFKSVVHFYCCITLPRAHFGGFKSNSFRSVYGDRNLFIQKSPPYSKCNHVNWFLPSCDVEHLCLLINNERIDAIQRSVYLSIWVEKGKMI